MDFFQKGSQMYVASSKNRSILGHGLSPTYTRLNPKELYRKPIIINVYLLLKLVTVKINQSS